MRMTKSRGKTDVTDVWLKYKATGDRLWRNVLMENYLPIVKYNSERVAAKLPDEVDNDDLMSSGIFGLIDAIDSFDLNRGVKFETYCAPRIRGAILDELRSMDWVPRLVRSRSHKIERLTREMEATLGHAPSEADLAKRMGMERRDFDKLKRDGTAVTQVSLARRYNENDSSKDLSEIDVIEDRRGRNPVVEIQKADVKELITKGLSRAERLILVLYYYEDMTMKEIGVTLDLSESRVSQMHSSVIGRLKTHMAKRKKELLRDDD